MPHHNIENYIQLKDAIETPIKKGQVVEYVKVDKRDREDSLKGKSFLKTIDVRTNARVRRPTMEITIHLHHHRWNTLGKPLI